jgi:thioredoxin-like negative regulator of GroEL
MQLLYFSASYCAPCKQFLPVVEKVCEQTGVELVKMDAESDEAQTYHIRGVPTLILVDGVKRVRNQGVMSEYSLRGLIRSLVT